MYAVEMVCLSKLTTVQARFVCVRGLNDSVVPGGSGSTKRTPAILDVTARQMTSKSQVLDSVTPPSRSCSCARAVKT